MNLSADLISGSPFDFVSSGKRHSSISYFSYPIISLSLLLFLRKWISFHQTSLSYRLKDLEVILSFGALAIFTSSYWLSLSL